MSACDMRDLSSRTPPMSRRSSGQRVAGHAGQRITSGQGGRGLDEVADAEMSRVRHGFGAVVVTEFG